VHADRELNRESFGKQGSDLAARLGGVRQLALDREEGQTICIDGLEESSLTSDAVDALVVIDQDRQLVALRVCRVARSMATSPIQP